MTTQPNARPKLNSPRSLSRGDAFLPDEATLRMEADGTKLNWRAIALVLTGIAVTSAGHYLTPPGLRLWHGIFQRLYYLPVVYAAIAFGWVGGLTAAVLAAVLYIPHIP